MDFFAVRITMETQEGVVTFGINAIIIGLFWVVGQLRPMTIDATTYWNMVISIYLLFMGLMPSGNKLLIEGMILCTMYINLPPDPSFCRIMAIPVMIGFFVVIRANT